MEARIEVVVISALVLKTVLREKLLKWSNKEPRPTVCEILDNNTMK